MPNRGDRGGSQTRARIAEVATTLFLEHGFDNVTIAEVAAAAGVSKVTIFAHFDRKEDLLLDRLPNAVTLVRDAVQHRTEGMTTVEAFRRAALDHSVQQLWLSGLSKDAEPFLRTVINSPALIARLRDFEHEVETELAAALSADPDFTGDSALLAALLVTAYRTVAIDTVHRRLAGDHPADAVAAQQNRLNAAFTFLASAP